MKYMIPVFNQIFMVTGISPWFLWYGRRLVGIVGWSGAVAHWAWHSTELGRNQAELWWNWLEEWNIKLDLEPGKTETQNSEGLPIELKTYLKTYEVTPICKVSPSPLLVKCRPGRVKGWIGLFEAVAKDFDQSLPYRAGVFLAVCSLSGRRTFLGSNVFEIWWYDWLMLIHFQGAALFALALLYHFMTLWLQLANENKT